MIDVILGGQWGDEGKGKLADALAQKYDMVARFNGGNNAGHTVVVDGKKYAFHLLPCGIVHDHTVNLIGNGVVLNMEALFQEVESFETSGKSCAGRLFISDRAQLLFRFHQKLDAAQEREREGGALGTTGKGIGPCYASKAARHGVRVGELVGEVGDLERFEAAYKSACVLHGVDVDEEELSFFRRNHNRIRAMIVDAVSFLHEGLASGKRILAEGANAVMLDIDHGTYPYVTSSNTVAGGVCTGLGVPPRAIDAVLGVVKAYTTRVGAGPFPTELTDDVGKEIQRVGAEFGTTTGRPRRCGWFDAVVVRYGNMLNGYTGLNLTKLDVLSGLDEIKVATAYEGMESFPSRLDVLERVRVVYTTLPGWKCDISAVRKIEDLPPAALNYVRFIEKEVGVPVVCVGVGPGREEVAIL